MFKKFIFILVSILCIFHYAYASISISTDHRALFFGPMQLGEEKELTGLGTYHNEIACSSTNNNTWYLKISLLTPLRAGTENIPLENFKWQLAYTTGTGTVVNPYQFKAFSLIPDLAYISGADEATGTAIKFQFKYYLKIPDIQTSGVYNTTIRFTLTEIM